MVGIMIETVKRWKQNNQNVSYFYLETTLDIKKIDDFLYKYDNYNKMILSIGRSYCIHFDSMDDISQAWELASKMYKDGLKEPFDITKIKLHIFVYKEEGSNEKH